MVDEVYVNYTQKLTLNYIFEKNILTTWYKL